MVSSGTLRRVTLVITAVSEERIASIITVTRIGELETTLAVTSNRRALRRNNIKCFEHFMQVLYQTMCDGGQETAAYNRMFDTQY
jgi:hypothetical protein